MLKGRFETVDEFAAKHPPEHGNGEKEARVRSNPVGVIEREPARGDDTVDMGMKLEFLVPGVEHTEEADLGSEMAGVTRHFQERFGAGTKQQTIDQFFVLQSQGSQLRRQSEHDMDVGRGEQFAATCLDPAFAGARLTLWAMAIAATVIRDGGAMSTAGALIDVTAESGGATARDGARDLDMGPADPSTVALDEGSSCTVRTKSATSRVGRLIYFSCCDLPFSTSESRGLAVACK
jgi:hypothetical protein